MFDFLKSKPKGLGKGGVRRHLRPFDEPAENSAKLSTTTNKTETKQLKQSNQLSTANKDISTRDTEQVAQPLFNLPSDILTYCITE